MTPAGRHHLAVVLAMVLVAPASAAAQAGRISEEFRREGEQFRESCGSLDGAMGCAVLLATGKPLHLAFGSIAPGNGLALGAAFGTRHNPNETWRLAWSADAVRTFGGSYRAGAYMRLVRTAVPQITVVTDPAEATSASELAPRPYPVVHLFAQMASLQNVSLFEPDNPTSRAVFGLAHRTVGVSTIVPISSTGWARTLNLSVTGQLAGRFVSLRDGTDTDAPGIFTAYPDATAPGLDQAPDHLELAGGLRVAPAGRYVGLDYRLQAQRFAGTSDGFSFTRWTADLDHEIRLYGRSTYVDTRAGNTPNDCDVSPGPDSTCPPVPFTLDRRGSLRLRVLTVTSVAGGDNRVPFYLQPTLGGRDINGEATLESYDDYRFRGPHLLLFQQTFEHSIWGPIGGYLRADQGMVADRRQALGTSGLKKSVAFGMTVRAGGMPMVVASYAVGGSEGRHFSVVVNTSLLGGSLRPSYD
ncbi:MAG: hypothetical protein DIU54_005125 [Acidobacteriota bacterium]|jgi:hypothetical protein